MTIVFAGGTAASLLVLAAIAARIDDDSRRDALDVDLHQRTTSLASTVTFDRGRLALAALYDDSVARTTRTFGVVADGRIELASPTQQALPDDAVIGRLVASSQRGAAYVAAPSTTGRQFRWGAAPVLDGDRVGATVLVGDDLTPSIAAHDRLLAGLAATVIALVLVAAALGHLLSGRAIRPLLQGLESQEQFLVEAAHELRTPLTTLRLITENGLRQPGTAAHALGRAAPQVDRLSRLIDGLLIRARVDAGTHLVELAPLRLDQLVELAVDEVVQAQGVDVQVDLEPTVVRGNPDLLDQAVRNLIENAVRHAERPRVVVRPTAVQVADSGPGIPEQERKRVLLGGRTRGSGTGTGTGLAIAAWVADVHGGRLTLDEAPGGGLLVTLALPRVASSSPHRGGSTLHS